MAVQQHDKSVNGTIKDYFDQRGASQSHDNHHQAKATKAFKVTMNKAKLF